MPAVRGDGMRGLAVFISDIRNCKSKEAEIKRINKELANIRSKFKVRISLSNNQFEPPFKGSHIIINCVSGR